MLKDSISRKKRSVNNKEEILVRQKELPFVILPKAVFLLKRNPDTQRYSLFRLIVLLGYLYSLAMTREKMAKTSYSELKKILNLKSKSTLQELFKFLEREGIISERVFHFKTSQKTEIILINSMEIPYVAQSWSEGKVREDLVFKVPKLLFVLPIEAYSKALYMYLCSLRKYASQESVKTTVRETGKTLRMDYKKVVKAFNELEKFSLITTTRTKKGTQIELLPTTKWNRNLILEAQRKFPNHPLIQIEEPGTNMTTPRTNMTTSGTNMTTQTQEKPFQDKSPTALLEDYIEEKTEDHTEDAANNTNSGGGEKNKEEIHPEKKRNQLTEGAEQKNKDTQKNAPSYKEPYGSNIKKARSPKLGNLNSGCAVDEQKRGEICQKIAVVADFLKSRYPEFFRNPIKGSVSDIYSGVIKTYGEDCGYLLVVMYELMARDKKLGYSSETIKNPNGFLISFVLKDSNSDFGEFFKKFLRKFGLQEQMILHSYSCFNNDEELLERLMTVLKDNTKPTLYRVLTKVVLGAYRSGSKVVIVCEDRMTVDFLRKNFLHILERAISAPVELICKHDIPARRNIE